jgi:CubicO group peptidase (beta-lactamase class C family)
MKTHLELISPAKRRVTVFRERYGHPFLAAMLLGPILLWLGAATLVASEIPVTSPAQAGLDETKLGEVDRFMERSVADQKMAGGIVVISHKGKIGFFHTYGQMDREARKPMRPDTIFRIYSMSKAITTAGALTLVDAGKLGLDDPVSKYIPSFANLKVAAPGGLRPPARPMTVRDLMLHTAGLTYGSGPEALTNAYARLKPLDSTNLAEMAEKLSQIPLAYDPGSDWIYSVSIDVLGRVIELASGQNLDAFLKRTIFEPLSMADTAFSVPPDKLDRFAANYRRSPEGLQVIDEPAKSKYAKPVTFFSGGGGLVSTARDYLRFLTMIDRGGERDGRRILKPETVKLMTSNQLPPKAFPIYFGKEIRYGTGFGLGFSVRTEITNWDPSGHVGEYGWGGAASTHYWASPADKLIVITLEQILPYQWDTEFGVKKLIYDALEK